MPLRENADRNILDSSIRGTNVRYALVIIRGLGEELGKNKALKQMAQTLFEGLGKGKRYFKPKIFKEAVSGYLPLGNRGYWT